ncbi:MAG: M36 family metallopeptidase, partial [Solirubrobacteraceae bacterium]
MLAPRAAQQPGAERPTRFANGDRARLTIFGDGRSERLAWRIDVTGAHRFRYEVVVDATTAAVLLRRPLTELASNALVHDYHPGAASGGTARIVDLAADPSWLSRSAANTMLRGNNAHAYADAGGVDGVDPGENVPASAGSDWVYPVAPFDVAEQACPAIGGQPACTWDSAAGTASAAMNREQATTQLFYFVNRFHDHLAAAPIGFTHAARNFEFTDADGLGPARGGDPVLAEADDAAGFDNAMMTTPTDGFSPRMEMFLFGDPSLNGADAADVVYHEYTHGLTNRSVGTGAGLSLDQSRALGEGWSDWYALDLLVAEGAIADTGAPGEVSIGTYLIPGGFRRQPADCPAGAGGAACPGTAAAGSGGFTLGDLGDVGSGFEVHDDGEIWLETLWDLRRALGSATARQLITGGLRLAPNNPSFLEARDAIIQADQALGGVHHTTLWQLFAARGMGFGALTTSAAATSAAQAFDLPPVLAHETTTVTDPPPGGDGDGIAEPGESVAVSEELRNLN